MKLSECCEIKKGQSITRDNVILGKIPVIAGGKKPSCYHNQSNRTGNTITSSASGANAGYINFFEAPIFASDCSTIKSVDEKSVSTKYIYYLLKSQQERIYGFQKGAGQPHVYPKDFENIEIPVPKIEIQNKIVAMIERAEEAKMLRKEADELSKDYLKSVFVDMFGDPVINNKKLRIAPLGEICKSSSGGTPSRSKKEYWEGGTIPWVKSGELDRGHIYDTGEKITEIALKNSSAKYFEPGTVLIAMYGATVGKTAILSIKATTNQAICGLTPKNNKELNNTYLLYTLNIMKDYMIGKSIGGGQPNISQQIIKTTNIIFPYIEQQNKFAEIVKQIEQMKEYQKKSKDEIDNLFNALIQKAFKGELKC